MVNVYYAALVVIPIFVFLIRNGTVETTITVEEPAPEIILETGKE